MSTYTIDTATSRATPTPAPGKRLTAPAILARKGGEPIVCLTAYDAPTAALLDDHCDLLLVGDSVGMVVHGLPNTVGVTLEMMILHGQAVMRGSRKAMVVVDMPFGSYEGAPEIAYANAVRIMKETGCQAVKVESGPTVPATIAYLVQRGIPVVGHVGLTPQAVNALGGYRARGRDDAEAAKVVADARAVAEAGAFAIVIEGVMEEIAAEATKKVACPTIGIGASASCDGQILVTEDMMGLFERTPRFVKRFGDLASEISAAAATYAEDVKSRAFPTDEQIYRGKK
jgi:3-methyl-2-oxobutanoate hydroxymethyltransferase